MSIIEKIEQIHTLIKEVGSEDPGMGNILLEGFGISLNTIRAVAEKGDREVIDLTEQVELVTKALGFSLEEIVKHVLDTKFSPEVNKEPDQGVLDFITSDLDDYEKFLAANKAKEDLNFLSKEI